MVLDFSAGRDFGIGMFGHDSTSDINAGVRVAEFVAHSMATIYARPVVGSQDIGKYGLYHHAKPTFSQYTLTGHAERSFHGLGPSLSWNASAALAGNQQDGELVLDWGIDAAILFGRQNVKTVHSTKAQHLYWNTKYKTAHYPTRYNHVPPQNARSRSVTVPNIGGFAGLSLKWTNAKISIGYRYDTFLNAMDIGIDMAKKSNVTFNGPYASISIGLGD